MFEEGWDWNKIYILILFTALVSGLFGVMYAAVQGSIQDGFAVSSALTGLGSLVLAGFVVRNL